MNDIQVVHFPNANGPRKFEYDEEWLGILRATHDLMSTGKEPARLPKEFPGTYL